MTEKEFVVVSFYGKSKLTQVMNSLRHTYSHYRYKRDRHNRVITPHHVLTSTAILSFLVNVHIIHVTFDQILYALVHTYVSKSVL